MQRKKLLVGLLFMVFLFLFLRNGIGMTQLTATPEMLLENFQKEMGDMIVTDEQSRVNVGLHDQSVFSLAPYSKLTIDKCVYDPQEKDRATRLSFFTGGPVLSLLPWQAKTSTMRSKRPRLFAGCEDRILPWRSRPMRKP